MANTMASCGPTNLRISRRGESMSSVSNIMSYAVGFGMLFLGILFVSVFVYFRFTKLGQRMDADWWVVDPNSLSNELCYWMDGMSTVRTKLDQAPNYHQQ
ncbi:hypothetical protein BV898_15530 [Hypsibius exemplaris]|uniref:Uncharacterized protein n=1 Tax=Hypsibius exemplaris TaxID=2072580 RepID=A0A9X6ND45_HYPEX|nr:hypothetical protein BV898_15530 [Hypsibius exemplaris]